MVTLTATNDVLEGAAAQNETALPGVDLLTLDLSAKLDQYKQQAATTLNADGAKTIIGTSNSDVIYSDTGVRFVNGDAGSDLIYGSDGDDYIEGDFSGDQGQGGNDIVLGGNGKDYIRGNQGQDILFGDAGDDMLMGGLDSDILWGGQGNDRLAGDGYFQTQSSDVFILARNSGKDTIVDFQVGVDRIGLSGDLAVEHLEFSQASGDTVVRDRISDSDIAVLKRVSADDLGPESFIESASDPAPEPGP
ncbi:MAG: hypothetical protein AAF289_06970, partial [Cyanobacteria bacterium P01_A01_bin.135]